MKASNYIFFPIALLESPVSMTIEPTTAVCSIGLRQGRRYDELWLTGRPTYHRCNVLPAMGHKAMNHFPN